MMFSNSTSVLSGLMSICFVCFVFLLYFTCITWQTNTKRRMLELFRIDGGQKGLGIFLVSYIGFCNWSLCWNSSMQLNRNLVCRSKRLLRTCFQSGTAALRFRNLTLNLIVVLLVNKGIWRLAVSWETIMVQFVELFWNL